MSCSSDTTIIKDSLPTESSQSSGTDSDDNEISLLTNNNSGEVKVQGQQQCKDFFETSKFAYDAPPEACLYIGGEGNDRTKDVFNWVFSEQIKETRLCNFYRNFEYMQFREFVKVYRNARAVCVCCANTTLHLAVLMNMLDVVRFLLKVGASPNMSNENGETPLHLACAMNSFYMCRSLLFHGAHPDAVDKGNVTPLHISVAKGHLDITRLLIDKGACVNAVVSHNLKITPLHIAVRRNSPRLLHLLIKAFAMLDAVDHEGETPLSIAVSKAKNEAIIKQLIYAGADIASRYKKGRTVLHIACKRKLTSVVQLLLEKGAEVNATDNYGLTPLHLAVSRGQIFMIHMLLQFGADVNAMDNTQRSPLTMAILNNQPSAILTLINYGAYIEDIAMPLTYAVGSGFKQVVTILLKYGADPNMDNHGETLLHFGVTRGDADMVLLLLQYGASINIAVNYGDWLVNSPIINVPISRGNVEVLKVLMRYGADITSPDGLGRTPIQNAIIANNPEMVRLLADSGIPSIVNEAMPYLLSHAQGVPDLLRDVHTVDARLAA